MAKEFTIGQFDRSGCLTAGAQTVEGRVSVRSVQRNRKGHWALQLRGLVDDPDVIPLPAQRVHRHDVLSGLIPEYRSTA